MLEAVRGESTVWGARMNSPQPLPCRTSVNQHKMSQCYKELLEKRHWEVGGKEATVGQGEAGGTLT